MKDGYSVLVQPDPDAVSPRDEGFENLGRMVIAPDRRFGKMTSDDPSDTTTMETLKDRMAEATDVIALPLYAIPVNPHGQEPYFQLHSRPFLGAKQGYLVGFIHASHGAVLRYFRREELSETLYEEALMRLGDEIMLMNTYLAGEVYKFEVRDEDDELVAEGSSIFEAELALDEAFHEIHRAREQVPSAFMM
ncbi:hypothetical protein [Roseivivax sp. CAU 1761]